MENALANFSIGDYTDSKQKTNLKPNNPSGTWNEDKYLTPYLCEHHQ